MSPGTHSTLLERPSLTTHSADGCFLQIHPTAMHEELRLLSTTHQALFAIAGLQLLLPTHPCNQQRAKKLLGTNLHLVTPASGTSPKLASLLYLKPNVFPALYAPILHLLSLV